MRCATCGTEASLRQFPAIFREAAAETRGAGGRPERPGEGGQCFSHPEEEAIAVCAGCGRFMCRDCDTEWDGERLCLSCIHDRREVRRDEGFVSRRFIYDNAALGLLAVPIVFALGFFWLGMFTAPMAIYFLLRHRGASIGFVPRSRFRVVLAWTLGVAMILLGLAGIAGLIYAAIELAVSKPSVN